MLNFTELHDEVNRLIRAAHLRLGVLEQVIATSRDDVENETKNINEKITTLREIRSLIENDLL